MTDARGPAASGSGRTGSRPRSARAPIAWIPLGALEFHADHLPNGTDGITGHGLLVERAAERLGGVVLPWSYLTIGTLALPWSFRYDPALVGEALRQTLRQLPAHGVRSPSSTPATGRSTSTTSSSGSAPRSRREGTGLRAMGLCYLELNAALGTGLGTDWPVAVDHALDDGDLVGRGAGAGPRGRSTGCPTTRRRPIVGRVRPEPALHRGRGAWRRRRSRPPRSAPRRSRLAPAPRRAASIRSRTCACSSSATGRSRSPWRAGPGRPRRRAAPPILLTNPGAGLALPDRASRLRLDGGRSATARDHLVNPTPGRPACAFAPPTSGPSAGSTSAACRPRSSACRIAVAPGRHEVELGLLAGRGHRDRARRDGRLRVSDGRPERVVRTVPRPGRPGASSGSRSSHEHLWMDSTPLLAVHGYRRRPPPARGTPRPRPRRAGTRAPPRQLPPDRRDAPRSTSSRRSRAPAAGRSSS